MFWSEGDFNREFIQMIGSRPTDTDARAAELGLPREVESRDAIRQYIATTGQFAEKYGPVARRVYAITTGAPPGDALAARLARRFARDGYSPDDLARDIAAGTALDEDAVPGALSEASERATELSMMDFARRWKSVTRRKIDVFEFIRYYPGGASDDEIARIDLAQSMAHATVSAVHKDYLGRGVSSDEFLESYLLDYQNPDFGEETILRVLASEEYRIQMCKRIRELNRTILGVEDMHPDDELHIFSRARERRAPLYGDEVTEEVISLSDEMRQTTAVVTSVYESVLGRAPDVDEVRECVRGFRESTSDAAAAALRVRLSQGLEFRDVIKERLRAKMHADLGRPPRPGELYSELERAIGDGKNLLLEAMGV